MCAPQRPRSLTRETDSSVHVVADPTSVVTSAAYLLFYRRRSSGPLGGRRFAEILDKYDKEMSGSDLEDNSGSDGRSMTKAANRKGSGPDDEEVPAYDETIRRSIEGDGAGDSGAYQPLECKSLDMTQEWNFSGLGARRTRGSTGGECGSDDGQLESSGDERGGDAAARDTDMASSVTAEDGASWRGQGVIAVPVRTGSAGDSDEVTEIHLEGDKGGRRL